MNSRQKKTLLIGAAVIALMLLFPPWNYFDPDTSGERSAGYHFFLTPPAPRPVQEVFRNPRFPYTVRARLNDIRFILQLATAIPLTLGLAVLFRSPWSALSITLAAVLISAGLFVLGFVAWLIVSYGLETGRWELP